MNLIDIIINGGSKNKIQKSINQLKKQGYLNSESFKIILYCWNKNIYDHLINSYNYNNLQILKTNNSLYRSLNDAHKICNSHFIYVLHEGEDFLIDSELLKDCLSTKKGKLISFDFILKSKSGTELSKYTYAGFDYNYYSMFSPHISTIIPYNLYKNYFYETGYSIISDYVLFSKFREIISSNQLKYFNLPICTFTYGGKSTSLKSLAQLLKEHLKYDLKNKRFIKRPLNFIKFIKFIITSIYIRLKMKNWET